MIEIIVKTAGNLSIPEHKLNYTCTHFNDGTVQPVVDEKQIKMLEQTYVTQIIFKAYFKNPPNDLFLLTQLKFLIDDIWKHKEKVLLIPYLPYARYDRKMKKYDVVSSDIFINLINMLNFPTVLTYDLHNAELNGQIKNGIHINRLALLQESGFIDFLKYDNIVSPDTGSQDLNRKIYNHFYGTSSGMPPNLPYPSPIQLMKKRDDVGNIEVLQHYDNESATKTLYAKRLIIVDDLLDEGQTFIKAAECLRGTNPDVKLDLYITHGLFSKGNTYLKLKDHFDNIYAFYLYNEDLKHCVHHKEFIGN